jgi:hypothetical protein
MAAGGGGGIRALSQLASKTQAAAIVTSKLPAQRCIDEFTPRIGTILAATISAGQVRSMNIGSAAFIGGARRHPRQQAAVAR